MRTTSLIALALLTLPVHAASTSPFNQPCLENQSIMASVQPSMAETTNGRMSPSCHRGQLSPEDQSQMESVRPSNQAPLMRPVITGFSSPRGQLGLDDISIIESVQPTDAIRRLDISLN